MVKTMQELLPGLYVGDLYDYENSSDFSGWISATKTIHSRSVGHTKGQPHYIYRESPKHLIINWVDGEEKYFEWAGPDMFTIANNFIDRHIKQPGGVLVHCDAGLSRSPTICMVYMAKRAKVIPDVSASAAFYAFKAFYPDYQPGGIIDYVAKHWEEIR